LLKVHFGDRARNPAKNVFVDFLIIRHMPGRFQSLADETWQAFKIGFHRSPFH